MTEFEAFFPKTYDFNYPSESYCGIERRHLSHSDKTIFRVGLKYFLRCGKYYPYAFAKEVG